MSTEEYNDRLNDLRFLLSDTDVIKFIIYLLIMIILAYPLMDIVSRSWSSGIMEQSAGTIRSISQSGISFLINVVIGFFVGSIILMFTDRRKKIQATILSIGLILIVEYMIGEFSVNWNIIYILLGIILGVIAGGGLKKGILRRQATMNICIVSILYIIISYLNIYMVQAQPAGDFLKDSIVVLGFSYFFGIVMNYKGKGKRIFVLGPGKSGKTVFMVGCYKIALGKAESPTRPNHNLREAFNQLHRPIDKRSKDEKLKSLSQTLGQLDESDPRPHELKEYWPRSTEEITDYDFIYEAGTLFPKEVLFRTIDYPGGFLGNLSNNMYNKIDKNTDGLTKTYIKISKEIVESDKLIFILDSNTYPVFDYITYYIDIINILHEKGKAFDSYIIVTKGDIFKEEFGKRPADNDYGKFKEFLEKKFSKNDYIKMLFTESATKDIYPVFYDTEKDERGTLKPLRNEDGNLFIFGFDEFMSCLME